jgi:uncharacterized protein (TIRG00374 family)
MPFGGRLGRATLGLAISALAIALLVRSVDIAAAWQTVQDAQPQWVALVALFVVGDVLLRAVRWRVLLAPIAPVALRATLGSLLVGYLANNALPARLGEIVRSHDLGERTGLSRSTILGTIVVERVVDTAVVVTIAAVAILVLSVRGIVASAVMVGVALTALLIVAIAAGVAAHRLPGAGRVARYIDRWPRLRGGMRRLREGLSVAGHASTMFVAIALSVGSWSLTVMAFAAAGQAVGVEPTMGQAALLAAGTNLATAIPAGPGYVGTFEVAVVAIAASVGIDAEAALALGLVVHGVTLAVTFTGGFIAFALGGRRPAARSAARPAASSTAIDDLIARGDGP